jgi:hypothetical protein
LISSVKPYEVMIPTEIKLLHNYPNPFNPSTIIRFYVPRNEYVNIKVFDINESEMETLINGEVPAGQHEIHWTPDNLASGIYIYSLQAGGFHDSKKMTYQK